ncbi:MAG: hypothetical protein HRU34_02030 [Richelia sp.]|nr:hypothetical protein [Richelia sp.]CDN10679.1 hypothetical protein RintRC_0643 [Richelia intracellularis]
MKKRNKGLYYYIRNITRLRGKRGLNLTQDPVPNLIMKIDVTRGSDNRLQIYADIGVSAV